MNTIVNRCRDLRFLRSRRRREGGAALVEFALIALPLFMILFGTIEFGWAFFQLNDVRHGAREGIRLVAVNADPSPVDGSPSDQGERLAQATCERMDRKDGVTITITIEDIDSNGEFEVGDDATIVASKPLDQLTNMFALVLDPVVLDETITTRLEQPWWDDQTPTVPVTKAPDWTLTWSCA